jgi:NADH-quinone oxidoreductase subunit H
LTFFTKVLFVCFLQAFVRWSLPRMRYDQLMKLGWRVLLPSSVANIFVTGCLVLVAQRAGDTVMGGLDVAGDVTQAVALVVLLALPILAIMGLFRPTQHKRWIVGSSAKLAASMGGTEETPMQA